MSYASSFTTSFPTFTHTHPSTTSKFPTKISATSTSHYETLGLKTTATSQQIKQAYRKLARTSHPDVRASAASDADEFIKIHSAYATLSDPEKRADYDRMMMMMSGKRRDVMSFEMATTSYGYTRGSDTTAFGYRRWETDQCW